MRNPRTTVALLLLALVLQACSGPREPLDVGVRRVASDIVLGTQGRKPPAPTIAPIPPAPVAVAIPTPVRVPAPRPLDPAPRPSATPTPEVCPEADPLSVPRHEALDNRGEPPVEESFMFTNEGQFQVTGANAGDGVFDAPTPRSIEAVEGGDGEDVTYDVVAELGGTVTRSSYLLRNVAVVDDDLGVIEQANVDEQRGLFLTSVVSTLPDGSESTFRPASPMRLLRFPVFEGDTFDEVGTDPLTGTVMSWTVSVVGSAKVDACGEFIDVVEVDLTDGQVQGRGQDVDFAASYSIATQYGGLIVRDSVVASGLEGGDTITRSNVATITSVPTHFTEASGGNS